MNQNLWKSDALPPSVSYDGTVAADDYARASFLFSIYYQQHNYPFKSTIATSYFTGTTTVPKTEIHPDLGVIIYLIQNSQAVKKVCGPQKGYGEKRCEIQGGGQEITVMVG